MALTVKDVLDKQNIPYREQGHDYVIRCLNPEHPDYNPSLRIDKLTGKMNCYSCGFKGSLFTHFGVTRDLRTEKAWKLKDKIRKLKNIGFAVPLGAREFDEDGYRGISKDTFKLFEAFTHLEDWEDRVVFPIKDVEDNIVSFIGRYIWSDSNPKYVVRPENKSLIPQPAKVTPIEGSIILVEGIFDMLNLHDKGLTNAVAYFGSTLSKNTLSMLLPYKLQGVSKINILFDTETESKTEKLKKALEEHFIIEILDIAKWQTDKKQDAGDLKGGQVRRLRADLYENSDCTKSTK